MQFQWSLILNYKRGIGNSRNTQNIHLRISFKIVYLRSDENQKCINVRVTNNNDNKYNKLLYRSIHLLYSHFLLCYLFIVYQVYIVARCSNTNSHLVISCKIVQHTGAFARKMGSPGRYFAEPPNEYTRARGEASRMGHEKFPGELNIHPSIEFFVSRCMKPQRL